MAWDPALDNAVDDERQDAFNRWPFCQRLARTIADFDASQGAPVFAIFGRWGDGKTSVLNLVGSALRKTHPRQVACYWFNPWMFRDADSLLLAFFNGLAAVLDAQIAPSGAGIGRIMSQYAGSLGALPYIGTFAAEVGRATGGRMAAERPVEELREKLVTALLRADRKTVVLIDDLDRLQRDEVLSLLKVVRLSANFPNIVYLLALDPDHVGRIAAEAYGDVEGRRFLEKIVRYPLALPSIPPDRATTYALRLVRDAVNSAGISLEPAEWEAFGALCRSVLVPVLGTPRQAIRYANAVRFALPMLKGEVHPVDQLLIEAIRVLFPGLHGWLQRQASMGANDVERALADVRAGQPGISDAASRAMASLLDALFRPDPPRPMPATESRYLHRLLTYAIAPDDVSDAQLAQIIELVEAKTQAPKLLVTLRDHLRERPVALIERLGDAFGNLRIVALNRLALALAAAGPVVTDPERCNALAMLIARIASHDMASRRHFRREVAGEALQTAQPLILALAIHRAMGRVQSQQRADAGNDEPDWDWDCLGRIVADRIAGDAARAPPYAAYAPGDALEVLKRWRETAPDVARDWLRDRLARHPGEASALLALFTEDSVMLNPWDYDRITSLAPPDDILDALRRAGRLEFPAANEAGATALHFLAEHRRRTGILP